MTVTTTFAISAWKPGAPEILKEVDYLFEVDGSAADRGIHWITLLSINGVPAEELGLGPEVPAYVLDKLLARLH